MDAENFGGMSHHVLDTAEECIDPRITFLAFQSNGVHVQLSMLDTVFSIIKIISNSPLLLLLLLIVVYIYI